MDICSIEDCSGLVLCRGWCNKHYLRWKRCGSPYGQRLPYGSPPEQRFWQFVTKDAADVCWEWHGERIRNGYGRLWISTTQRMLAHRFAYELLIGPIPEGLDLDHLCRNRSCVNPAHLEPVTNRENVIRGNRFRNQTQSSLQSRLNVAPK
jgi:hypothetical protein